MDRRFLLAGAMAALIAGCSPPKYIEFRSKTGDVVCQVPWGWTAYLDSAGPGYYNYTFVGPFDAQFYHGVPSYSIRWYGYNKPRSLPGGGHEFYASADDYVGQMLKDVYGSERFMDQDVHKIRVAAWEALHFVVSAPVDVPRHTPFGAVRDASGEQTVILRKHAYVVLPMDNGFYALIYPATRNGYGTYEPKFNNLVNTFRVIKDGPSGRPIR